MIRLRRNIQDLLRRRVLEAVETVLEEELSNALGTSRYERSKEIGHTSCVLAQCPSLGVVSTPRRDALDAAQAAGGDPKAIEKAQRELARLQQDLDDGAAAKAVHHYRKAWEKAQQALSDF